MEMEQDPMEKDQKQAEDSVKRSGIIWVEIREAEEDRVRIETFSFLINQEEDQVKTQDKI